MARRTMIYPDGVKTCAGCEAELPLSQFSPLSYEADQVTVRRVGPRCRPCSRARVKAAPPKQDADNPRLPIGPFREFLSSIEAQFESEAEFAEALGVWERRLYGWRYENQTIPLDGADAALCKLGLPHMLRELWPELYQFDEDIAA